LAVPIVLETPQRESGGRSPHRLAALDGLRALAIVWVMLFHYCYFWTPAAPDGLPLVAYGAAHASLPFVSVGYLGVHLFFVISGFVILMTIERADNLGEFLLRRAIRLWPALLLFGTATFVIVSLYGPKELQVGWWEYLFSLVVLPPQHVALLVGASNWQWLDGAYWSLWVEVKFYFVLGFLYFAFSRNVIGAWLVYELFAIVIGVADFAIGGKLLHIANGFFFAPFVPYFSFGLAAYSVWCGRDTIAVRLLTALAIVHICLVSAADLAQQPPPTVSHLLEFVSGQAAIFLLFYLFAWRRAELRFFQWSPLARVGRASYGIYLLHQNVGVTILSASLFAAAIPGLFGLLFVLAAVTASALIIYESVEKPAQAWLKRRLFSGQAHKTRPLPEELAREPAGT
jgi:peptidoglycan/LPS O-acetylase OafA/YrhL